MNGADVLKRIARMRVMKEIEPKLVVQKRCDIVRNHLVWDVRKGVPRYGTWQ